MKSLRLTAIAAVLCVLVLGSLSAVHANEIEKDLADFVFIIDCSESMADDIVAVQNGLGAFAAGLDAAKIDARFAIVLYGSVENDTAPGPELVLDFTGSVTTLEAAFGQISTAGAVPGFQLAHNRNPEPGLEAIRIVLGEATDNTLARDNVGGTGGLVYRDDARKNLILVTDEDSDWPIYPDNRMAGQVGVPLKPGRPPAEAPDPTDPAAWAAWQAEINATAAAAIEHDAYINMLINPENGATRYQYGDPAQDVSDPDFLNFDPDATLANMIAAGYGGSLEAQLLAEDLIGRSFDIANSDDPDFIDNFFAAKIEEQFTNGEIPEPATLILLGAGLVGLVGYSRRRRGA